MKGQSTFGSGDINLAAALVTIGIPPDPVQPIELIARDNGKDYRRFHFLRTSPCGKYDVNEMSLAWSDPASFKRENPAHPFALVMDFIATRPNGCGNQDEWLCHAASFLGLSINSIRAAYKDITRACAASPESPASYVLAFIRNRMDLIHAIKRKAASGDFSAMQSAGKSVSLISEKAPSRIKNFLLSHIR